MKMYLIVGEPGAGKTRLVKTLAEQLGAPTPTELVVRVKMSNGVNSNPAKATAYPRFKVLIPGVYDGSLFEGTDRLGKNCTGALVQMLETFATLHPDWTVVAEGDRIANQSVIRAMFNAGVDLSLIHLDVPSEVCAQRRREREAERGAEFFANTASKNVAGKPRRADRLETGVNATWVKGRQTKQKNLRIFARRFDVPVWVVDNSTPEQLKSVVRELYRSLEGTNVA